MPREEIAVFRPYPFKPGQKIHIETGPRCGDWQVLRVGERTVTLQCPVSGKVFEWSQFCYMVDEQTERPWPDTGSV
ncbi:MAG: hypothetical protein JRI36_03550 [Deltaproteobacteria bacterium]|nr:hypothetical protein [Deltaproteobacteria bacterium]